MWKIGMHVGLRLALAGLLLTHGACTRPTPVGDGTGSRAPGRQGLVVVELFTSEGCSSCPPTDRLVRELAEDSERHQGDEEPTGIVVLGFHVDYWDELGWRDRFSEPSHTKRQRGYAAIRDGSGIFTPEAIVDGSVSVAGSRRSALAGVIRAAAERTKATLRTRCREGVVLVDVQGLPPSTLGDRPVLLLAITERRLRTDVLRGENAGRVLKHAPVVRMLVDAGPATLGEHPIDIEFEQSWKRNNLSVVTFIQEVTSRRILGAASAEPCD